MDTGALRAYSVSRTISLNCIIIILYVLLASPVPTSLEKFVSPFAVDAVARRATVIDKSNMNPFVRARSGPDLESGGRTGGSSYCSEGARMRSNSGAGGPMRSDNSNSIVTAVGDVAKTVGAGVGKAVTVVGTSVGKAVTTAGAGVGKAVTVVGTNVGKAATTAGVVGLDVAVTGVTAGIKGVASSGKGFREFLLKGPVVELAVAGEWADAAAGLM